jgi:Tol biopolymer transport system component
MKLRDALGDSADKPLYIETVPKRGYRFVAPASVASGLAGPGPGKAAATSGLDPVRSSADATVGASLPSPNGVRPPASRVPLASPAEPGLAGASTSKRFRWLQVFSIAISLAAVGAGLFWFFHRRLTTNQPRAEQRVTSNSPEAPIKSAVVSPDGKYLAYSDPTGLYLRVIATGETRRWTLPKDFIAHATSWFPDGTHLLVVRLEGPMQTPSLWKLSMLGASPRKLIDNADKGVVSPDGSRIAFLTAPNWERELWVMSSDGSNRHKIAAADQTEQLSSRENQICPFVWSPDGQRVAYIERHVAPTVTPVDDIVYSLQTRDANGGDLHVILDDNRLRHALAWAPDGRILFAYREDPTSDHGDEGVRSIRVDPYTGKATGELQFLTNGSGSIAGMSVSSDGMRLVFLRNNTGTQSFIAEFEANTRKWKTPRLLTLEAANHNGAEAWLPDSRTVLFVSNRNRRWTLFK